MTCDLGSFAEYVRAAQHIRPVNASHDSIPISRSAAMSSSSRFLGGLARACLLVCQKLNPAQPMRV